MDVCCRMHFSYSCTRPTVSLLTSTESCPIYFPTMVQVLIENVLTAEKEMISAISSLIVVLRPVELELGTSDQLMLIRYFDCLRKIFCHVVSLLCVLQRQSCSCIHVYGRCCSLGQVYLVVVDENNPNQ